MNAPDKEEIEALLIEKAGEWSYDDILSAYQQLKNLYEHWYRLELK